MVKENFTIKCVDGEYEINYKFVSKFLPDAEYDELIEENPKINYSSFEYCKVEMITKLNRIFQEKFIIEESLDRIEQNELKDKFHEDIIENFIIKLGSWEEKKDYLLLSILIGYDLFTNKMKNHIKNEGIIKMIESKFFMTQTLIIEYLNLCDFLIRIYEKNSEIVYEIIYSLENKQYRPFYEINLFQKMISDVFNENGFKNSITQIANLMKIIEAEKKIKKYMLSQKGKIDVIIQKIIFNVQNELIEYIIKDPFNINIIDKKILYQTEINYKNISLKKIPHFSKSFLINPFLYALFCKNYGVCNLILNFKKNIINYPSININFKMKGYVKENCYLSSLSALILIGLDHDDHRITYLLEKEINLIDYEIEDENNNIVPILHPLAAAYIVDDIDMINKLKENGARYPYELKDIQIC